jgi:hypothetical protein
VPVPWLQSSGGDYIDVPTEEVLQFRGEVEYVEQRASRLEVDKEIDVAIGTVVAARRRPEEPHSSPAAPSRRRPYLLAMPVDQRPNAWCLDSSHVHKGTGDAFATPSSLAGRE